MGKKWRDAAEMERGCSDREDNAESRRRSRSASRGRFAESWKRLSSKQGSTKRSGLPSQQMPLFEMLHVNGDSMNKPGSVPEADLSLLDLECDFQLFLPKTGFFTFLK
ncbi:hypothetical protein CB1_026915008 [Camelus ferus]|nr:hypothetical protein CB1_026915008 [Camelus ferus]